MTHILGHAFTGDPNDPANPFFGLTPPPAPFVPTVTPDAPILRDAAGNVIQGRTSTQQNFTIPGAPTGGFTTDAEGIAALAAAPPPSVPIAPTPTPNANPVPTNTPPPPPTFQPPGTDPSQAGGNLQGIFDSFQQFFAGGGEGSQAVPNMDSFIQLLRNTVTAPGSNTGQQQLSPGQIAGPNPATGSGFQGPIPENFGITNVTAENAGSFNNLFDRFLRAMVPGLLSGTLTNQPGFTGGLNQFFESGDTVPQDFSSFQGSLLGRGGDSPLQNQISSSLQSQIAGLGGIGDFGLQTGGRGDLAGVAGSLLGQPATQSVSTGLSSQLLQQLATQGGGIGSGLQNFLQQQLQQSILGGGLDERTAQAQRDRILQPALEARQGLNNRQGGGVAGLDSGLFQELNRRTEQEFLQDQLIQANQNLQSQFGQAGDLGQNLFGQLAGVAGAQGQLGQAQQGLNQQAIGLGGDLASQQQGFIQQALQQALGREQFSGQFGQQNIGNALDFAGISNQFNTQQLQQLTQILNSVLGTQGSSSGLAAALISAGGDVVGGLLGGGGGGG